MAFEIGPGPILWLYLAETCNNKAMSVNTVVCWVWTLVVSIVTPLLFKAIAGYTWLLFASTSSIGLFYITMRMKETKGVPKEQLSKLYDRKIPQVSEPLLSK